MQWAARRGLRRPRGTANSAQWQARPEKGGDRLRAWACLVVPNGWLAGWLVLVRWFVGWLVFSWFCLVLLGFGWLAGRLLVGSLVRWLVGSWLAGLLGSFLQSVCCQFCFV